MKFDEGAWEFQVRRERDLNSQQLSSSFGLGFIAHIFYVFEVESRTIFDIVLAKNSSEIYV